MTISDVEGFSGKRAAEIVGITYRQLDYWARTDLIRPSVTDASGSGTRRRYSYKDLLELKVISGTSAVLVREGELVDVVNRYQGQGVLNLLPMDGVVQELDAAVADVTPLAADDAAGPAVGGIAQA